MTVRAQYVLDCSGRTGIVARRGLRRSTAGYRTLAIAAEWSAPRWPEDERTRTVVESYRDGWSWSVPLSDTTRQCTVMIDPEDFGRTRHAGPARGRSHAVLQDAYRRELAKTRMLSARTATAVQTSAPWACDASLYDCARAAERHAILVGDAASFVEPLSSAGVKKAMLSAWRAAVVTNTCLRDSRRTAIALEYHGERERHVFESCARQASAFFTEAADAHGGRFWTVRQAFGSAAAEVQPADAAEEHLLAGEDVTTAFDELRCATAARLRVSPALRFESAPAIEGCEVVLRDALALHGLRRPIRFASNIDLPALVSVIDRHGDVASATAAYRTEVNRVAAADVLRGLSLLVARRAVLHEGIRS